MKFLCLFALTASLATADSHPSWWSYASPEATALVGIQWDNLRDSPLAPAIEAELSSTGPLGFPDLECLKQAHEIVISSPELLAAEAGSFPAATVKEQAQRAGLHRLIYRGLTLWVPDKASSLGVAEITGQIVLVGARKTLEAAIDASLLPSGRPYSGLLPKAAHFSQTGDLWVVAVKLPDPLASQFVPLDAEGWGFMGQVSLRDGLSVEGSFDASSTSAATEIAAKLEDEAQSLPAFAQGLEVTSDRRTVNIELHASAEELAADLRAAPAAAPAAVAAPATAAPTALAQLAPAVVASVAKPAESRPTAEATPVTPPKPKPEEPQILRIVGLDDGPREIVLPPLPEPRKQ